MGLASLTAAGGLLALGGWDTFQCCLEPKVFEQGPAGQMDNGNGHTEDCVHTQQMCNDIYCDATYQWVCKKSVGHDVA